VETIFVLLPLALLIAAIAVGLFIWAARSGQFDDLETPAVRILFDDEEPHQAAVGDSPGLVRRSVVGADTGSADKAKAETRRVSR
jgi:cbb3-type cytochrome oxidase maturation protein